MIFFCLKFLFRISTKMYFRNLEVKGLEHISATGPVLLVANHPSTFMDPVVIATTIQRRIYFLAKAEIFKSSFSKWILPKFNMIPIYRAQDDPTQLMKNKETFAKSYEHLENGGAILIFPEGISMTDRKLKKIKTGAARIALGAEAECEFKLGVQIITVGLTYSNPHRFQSDLFINIDAPLHVSDYQERYTKDQFQAANDLTDAIRIHLEKQVVTIEDASRDKLVKNIEIIYKSQLIKDLGYSAKVKEHDFLVTRAISERVHYFYEHEPARVERIRNTIDTYFTTLDRMQLKDKFLKRFPENESIFLNSIWSFLYMTIGLPIFIFGFTNNYLPYKIPGWITQKITKLPEFAGALAISLGTLTFLIFYGIQLWLMQHYFHTLWLTLVYLLLLPLTGLYAFFYWKRFTNIRGKWMIFSLFYKKTKLITSLMTMRQGIIDDLEKGRKEYTDKTVNVI